MITDRSELAENEDVIEGRFWDPTPTDVPEVSIEEGLRDRAGLSLGDRVTFDILGRRVEARVTSVRRVDWADARAGGFMFVFRPGPLDSAPRMFIAPVKGPPTADGRAALQRTIVDRFPNVSVVDVQEILAGVAKIVNDVTLAVTVVGSLVLFSGVLILVGSISMTKFQRVRGGRAQDSRGHDQDGGAPAARGIRSAGPDRGRHRVRRGLGLSWAVSRFAFEVPWTPVPVHAAAGLAGSVLLVSVVGLAASLDVLRRRPLATLRAE